jgi:hypothetical protein
MKVNGRLIAIAGAILVIIGSLLPWATVDTPFGSVSKNGTEGDGVISLILGVFIILGALFRFNRPGNRPWIAFVFAVLALALGIFEYVDISSDASSISGGFVDASVGIGVYVVILGALLGLASFMRNPSTAET